MRTFIANQFLNFSSFPLTDKVYRPVWLVANCMAGGKEITFYRWNFYQILDKNEVNDKLRANHFLILFKSFS